MLKLSRFMVWGFVFAILMSDTSDLHAQGLGALTNGSLDPTNKNNKLGFVIRTPGSHKTETSNLQVMTPKIDEHGYYYEESPHGSRYYDKSKRGTLLRDAHTGRAFWQLGGLTCLAAPQYQHQLDQQERNRREQELQYQREMQIRYYQQQQAEAYRRHVEYQQWQVQQRNEVLRQQLQGLVDAIERRQGNNR